MSTRCIECGDELLRERAELGYAYCTKKECQAGHRSAPVVTAVAVNKSGDSYLVADPSDVAARAAAGEFGRKNATLGADPLPRAAVPAPRRPTRTTPPAPTATPPARRWTDAQENIVRLYADMGLSPRQIAARARENTPRLGITERLAVTILSGPRRR
jgi:hypothetical protein